MINRLRYEFAQQGIPLRGSSETVVEVGDFLVDEVSLLRTLSAADGGKSRGFGGVLGWAGDEEDGPAKQLLGLASPELLGGRVLIYECEACRDIWCGGYGVRVSVLSDTVVWSDFAFVRGDEEMTPLVGVGSFMFDIIDYFECINKSRNRAGAP